MKNVRFYLEYESLKDKRKATVKNPGNHTGSCVAVLLDAPANPGKFACFVSTFYRKNSDTSFSEVAFSYLNKYCKRIPEKLAKKIHPKLYNRLLQE